MNYRSPHLNTTVMPEKLDLLFQMVIIDFIGRNGLHVRILGACEYFRANIWSWHPIHALIIELCSHLLDEETLNSIALNDSAGPEDQEACTEMARRFEV
jgi:hypothetical protein